jgi:alkyl hydroperoxide reductase subunit AhpF
LLADRELMLVQEAANAISIPVTLVVHKSGIDSAFEKNITNIAAQISGVSMGRIGMDYSQEPVVPGKPSLSLCTEKQWNIHYLAAPEGNEFEAFVDAIGWLGGRDNLLDERLCSGLSGLAEPAHTLLLISSACPNCPHVVRVALALAVAQPLITLTIVDALEFSDITERFNVKAVPTTIINDTRTLVGRITANSILEALLSAQKSESLTADLESMINSGRAIDAAALLCKRKQPQAILPLYISTEFASRVGALVTIEEALARDPRIMDSVLDDLGSLLFHEDAGLRGDTADLLGKIGNPAAIPSLRKALSDPNPDVREAVEEALQRLG